MFQNCSWCLSFTLKSLCSTLYHFTNGNFTLCSLCTYINCFHLFMPVASMLELCDCWINNFSPWITFFHAIHVCCQTVQSVCNQSEVCLSSEHELILKNSLEIAWNSFTQWSNEGEICLHRFHQWNSMPFFSGTILLQKIKVKVVCFHSHPSTNWL